MEILLWIEFHFNTSSPRYPRSNGLAERFVQTAKNILLKSNDMWAALMEYRNTPITGLKMSPAELLFGRKLKTKLPVMVEQNRDFREHHDLLQKRNELYKLYYNQHTRERTDFNQGDKVVYKNGRYWQPGVVTAKHNSPRSYLVDTGKNVIRRNSNHLRASKAKHLLKMGDGEEIECDPPMPMSSGDKVIVLGDDCNDNRADLRRASVELLHFKNEGQSETVVQVEVVGWQGM